MSLQKRFKKPAAPVQQVNLPSSVPRLVNLQEAARYLSAHPWALRQMVRRREIPYVKLGRGYLIDRHDLDVFIAKNKVGVVA